MYGYELVQAIRSASGERLSFGEGCIYPILHRLEGQGFLASRSEIVNGRNRVVYHVTKDGGGRLARSAAHWAQVVQAVNGILFGDRHAEPIFA
jgi:PadR family transcriptional regulator PadR